MAARVFVSSVVEGFGHMRKAAREGILAAGGEPVLVNEDFPALNLTPRDTCLDAVASCDIYLAVLGERGGFAAPSGKLVVEEEYEEAIRCQLPVLVFVQSGARDEAQNALIEKLSGYVDGRFRVQFESEGSLRQKIESALGELMLNGSEDVSRARKVAEQAIESPICNVQSPTLRVTLCPTRSGEVFDPRDLESGRSQKVVLEVGHQVEFFDYVLGYETRLDQAGLVISPRRDDRFRQGANRGSILVHESGTLILENNVTGIRPSGNRLLAFGLCIVERDVATQLARCLTFSSALLERHDPFQRYSRWAFSAGLFELGHHTLMAEEPAGSSISVSVGSKDACKLSARVLSRQTLARPEDEVDRAIAMFRRSLGSPTDQGG